MASDTITIACAFDERMAIPALGLVRSLHQNNPLHSLSLHLMHSGVNSELLSLIKKEVAHYAVECTFYEAERKLSITNAEEHYPPSIFYRLELFEILKSESRCIYLDADTMVRRDLHDLYSIDLCGLALAAMPDYALKYHGYVLSYAGTTYQPEQYMRRVLNLTQPHYFNTGVMVIDLEMWHNADLGTKCLEYCLSHPGLVMPDQDALNHLLDGKFVSIDCRYNAFPYLKYLHREIADYPSEWKEVLQHWTKDPWIVHFAYRSKPWEPAHFETDFDEEYWNHVMQTEVGRHFLRQYITAAKSGTWLERRAFKQVPAAYRPHGAVQDLFSMKIRDKHDRADYLLNRLETKWDSKLLAELLCTLAAVIRVAGKYSNVVRRSADTLDKVGTHMYHRAVTLTKDKYPPR